MKMRQKIPNALMISVGLIAALSINGQIPGGMDQTTATDMGGRAFIVGTIFGPTGLPVNSRIRIRLASMTSREVITTTDDYGKFSFSGLRVGTYTVNIDEDEDYLPQTQQIEIQNPRDAYAISFRLTLKVKSQGKPAVVESSKAGVPKKALDHYNEGLRLSKERDFVGAITELKAAIQIFPKFAVAITELGVQQLNIGQLEEADKSFAAALELTPDAYEPTINRGIGLFRQKSYEDAERYLRAALKLKEGSTIGHYYLGRTLMARDKLDDAEAELKVAENSINNPMMEVHRMLTQLYIQKGDYKKAHQELEKYLAANPTAPDVEHLREVLKQLEQATATTEAPQKP